MNDTDCPYCGANVFINHDDGYGYEEDEIHHQECGKCKKTFSFTTSISFHYSTYKAACLNGGEHRYEETKTYPVEFSRMVCTDCGHKMPKPTDAAPTKDDASTTPPSL